MLVADVVAEILAREQVPFITGFPENRLLDSSAARGIVPVIARTERVAVNIADGYARMNGGAQPGVCAVQDGPGGETAYGAMAQAYADRSPVLLISGAFDRGWQGVTPNFDPAAAYRSIVQWSVNITDVRDIPGRMHSAFARLRSGSGGPVVVAIARDVMNDEFSGPPPAYIATRAFASGGDPDDIDELTAMLARAKRPVIVAGQGVLYAGASQRLVALAEATATPVMTTLNGKSAFPEDHPLALGTGGRSRTGMVKQFLAKADFILGIGTSFTPSDYITAMPTDVTLAQVTSDERDIGKWYPVSAGAIGDARLVVEQLLRRARRGQSGSRSRETVSREVSVAKRKFINAWRARLESSDRPISPYRLVWELNRVFDKSRTVLTHDSGNPRDQLTPFYEATTPHGYVGWGKTTQLGSGLGLMFGARLAQPGWLAVNVMGDAAIGMVGTDLETGVRAGMPVLTVVMKNGVMGGYGVYMPNAIRLHRSNELSGDYRALAEALGAHGEHVEDPDELGPALERCAEEVRAGRSTLLEVVTREEPDVPL